jgi:hypothetical protein
MSSVNYAFQIYKISEFGPLLYPFCTSFSAVLCDWVWPSLFKIQDTELKLSCGNDPVVKNYIYSNSDLDLWPKDRFHTITLVLYIGSLPNLATWFPFGRGRTLFILGSLPLYRLIIYIDSKWYGFTAGFVSCKKGCTRLAVASNKAYQLLAHGR